MFFFTPLFEKYKLNIKDSLLPGAPVPVPPDDYGSDLIDEPAKPSTSEKVEESAEKVEESAEKVEESAEKVEESAEKVEEDVKEPPSTTPKKKSSYRHKWFG